MASVSLRLSNQLLREVSHLAADRAPPPAASVSAAPKRGRPFKRSHGEPALSGQENITGPDSRITKTGYGIEQSFTAQTAMEAHAQITLAAELTDRAADNAGLPKLLQVARENTGTNPQAVMADV